jgi:putative hydrolase of the HAD superfamily
MRTFDPSARRELERRFNLEPGTAYELVFKSPCWDEAQHGRIDSQAFWADLGERLGLESAEIEAFRSGFWAGDRLDPEMLDAIRHYRQAGYRTALLSNASAGLPNYLVELGIDDVFDVIVVSGVEGVAKPDAQIYLSVLERLGVEPQEAVFVDDMRVNVEAARNLGLHALRFRGPRRLFISLEDMGIPSPELRRDPVPDVRAVIFDWGGVMEQLPSEADVAAWERRLAIEPGVLPEVLWGQEWHRLEVGAITDGDYARYVADQLGFPGQDEALDFLQAFYTSDRLNESVVKAARALRDRYQVALLSNAFPAQSDFIRDQYGIDVYDEYDLYVNSAHVGLSKPDPAIYYLTLEQLGVGPEQAIFLDDSLRNVDSARHQGIHAVHFVDPVVSLPDLELLLGHAVE